MTPQDEITGPGWSLLRGDCRPYMAALGLAGTRFSACITDPPFHLTSMEKRFGKAGSARAQHGEDGAAERLSRGFMGAKWDGVPKGEVPVAFDPATWALVLGLLEPGGRLLAFGGTRTWHRMACAIEAAGFEIEDSIAWTFGQGLVLKRTRMKPGWSPIVVARVPGPVRELGIEDCRVGGTPEGRWPANLVHDGSDEVVALFPAAPGQQADASLTAPSCKTNAVYGHLGRGSREGEASADRRYADSGGTNFAVKPGQRRHDTGSAARFFNACPSDDAGLLYRPKVKARDRVYFCTLCGERCMSGGRETHRHGMDDWAHLDTHPTTKPVSLLRHLVRLVTHPGDAVIDPFGGSGVTAEAALREGRKAVTCEAEEHYADDIAFRLDSLDGIS